MSRHSLMSHESFFADLDPSPLAALSLQQPQSAYPSPSNAIRLEPLLDHYRHNGKSCPSSTPLFASANRLTIAVAIRVSILAPRCCCRVEPRLPVLQTLQHQAEDTSLDKAPKHNFWSETNNDYLRTEQPSTRSASPHGTTSSSTRSTSTSSLSCRTISRRLWSRRLATTRTGRPSAKSSSTPRPPPRPYDVPPA